MRNRPVLQKSKLLLLLPEKLIYPECGERERGEERDGDVWIEGRGKREELFGFKKGQLSSLMCRGPSSTNLKAFVVWLVAWILGQN